MYLQSESPLCEQSHSQVLRSSDNEKHCNKTKQYQFKKNQTVKKKGLNKYVVQAIK